MSNINQYPLTATQINDEDFYDVDYWNGSAYESRKISGLTLKTILGALASTLYNSDGQLSGNRIVDGQNFELLFQTLGQFEVHSHANNIDNVIFEVRSDAVYHGFIVRDHNTGVHMLACRDGKVEISDAYFLPATDGLPNQIMMTDGAGNVIFTTVDLAFVLGEGNETGANDIVLSTELGDRIIRSNNPTPDDRMVMKFINIPGQDGFYLHRQAENGGAYLILGLGGGGVGYYTGLLIGHYMNTTPNGWLFAENDGINKNIDIQDKIVIRLDSPDNSGFWGTLTRENLTADRNWQLPNKSGVIALISDIPAGAGDNIYNTDGNLLANRTVNTNGFDLTFATSTNGFVFIDDSNANLTIEGTIIGTTPKLIVKGQTASGTVKVNDQYAPEFLVYQQVTNGGILNLVQAPSVTTRTQTFQDADGTIALLSDIPTGLTEKHVDTFYAYDMSGAAAGGGTYNWNGTAVGTSALTTLNESVRFQLFSGTGQADGCFVNSIMPNYYTPNADINITLAFSVNGTGGDVKFFVGLQQPNGANFGADVDTIWTSYTFTAVAGFPVAKTTLTFAPTNISPAFPIVVKVYRDPGDVADTYTGDAYLNTIGIEIA